MPFYYSVPDESGKTITVVGVIRFTRPPPADKQKAMQRAANQIAKTHYSEAGEVFVISELRYGMVAHLEAFVTHVTKGGNRCAKRLE